MALTYPTGISSIADIAGKIMNIIPSIFQMHAGNVQMGQANALEDQYKRPTYTEPKSISDLVNYSRGLSMANDIPGGDLYRNQIQGATAAGMTAAKELGSGAEAYGALGKLVSGENSSFRSLAEKTASYVSGNQSKYMGALGQEAGYQDKAWQWNEADPYLMAAKKAAQLRDSGLKNQYAGLGNLAGTGAEYMSNSMPMNSLYGRTFNPMSPQQGNSGNLIQQLMNLMKGGQTSGYGDTGDN